MSLLLRNQKGITLVELLAAIVIVGFLAVLIWRFFFQTIDYNSYAVTEQTLQQEANVILATLQSEHARNTIVEITGGSMLTIQTEKGEVTLDRPNIEYILLDSRPEDPSVPTSGTTAMGSVTSSTNSTTNRKELEINLVLTTNYKEGRPLYYLLSTRLSKLVAQ